MFNLWLMNHKPALSKAINIIIEMKIVISKTIVNKKAFTAQEIFQEMVETNPALKDLTDELGLEIK